MSTYTCQHCGEHGLSTQKRHWCPKAPKISEVLRLGPPRSHDPIANEYIARLTRELEEARERERALREALVEVAIPLEAFWMVMHDSDLLSAEVREAVQKALGIVRRTVGATTAREGGE